MIIAGGCKTGSGLIGSLFCLVLARMIAYEEKSESFRQLLLFKNTVCGEKGICSGEKKSHLNNKTIFVDDVVVYELFKPWGG